MSSNCMQLRLFSSETYNLEIEESVFFIYDQSGGIGQIETGNYAVLSVHPKTIIISKRRH